MQRKNIVALLWIALAIIGLVQPTSGQNIPLMILMEDVDTTNYPAVTASFSLVTPQGLPVTGLTEEDLLVSIEGGEAITETLTYGKAQQELAVAVVLDLSASMNDESTPFRSRYSDANDKITDLLNRLPPNTQLSLVTFSESSTVAFPLQADGGGFRNALNQLAPQGETPGDAPYDIVNAMSLALNEVQDFDGPKGIFIFGAGSGNATMETNSLKYLLDSMSDDPPLISVISLGSSEEGQFQTTPANPESMARLAQSIDATFIPIFANEINQVKGIMEAVDASFSNFIERHQLYQISFEAPPLSRGEHMLALEIGAASTEAPMTVEDVRPEISLLAPEVLSGTIPLSIEVLFAQGDIASVEYFIDDIPIETSEEGPDFAVSIDAASLIGTFTPDEEHRVFAAATDSNGQTNRSEAVDLLLVAPPPAPTTNWALIGGAIAAGVLALLGLIFFLVRRRRNKQMAYAYNYGSGSKVSSKSIAPQQEPARGGYSTPNMPAGATLDDNIIPSAGAGATMDDTGFISGSRYKALVYENGRAPSEYNLRPGVNMVGRFDNANRQETPDIELNSNNVSRRHTTINVNNGEVTISDQGSTNGTFIADKRSPGGKRRLQAHMPHPLKDSESFWVGKNPQIEIKIVED